MNNFIMLSLILIGLGISISIVRKVNLHRNGELLSWTQAASVVFVRTTTAITTGFLLGVVIGKAIETGVISKQLIAENKLIAISVVMICSVISFLAFQWMIGQVTKQPVKVKDALKAIGREFVYYGKVLFCLFLFFILILSVASIFGMF